MHLLGQGDLGCSREGFLGRGKEGPTEACYRSLGGGNCSDLVKLGSEGLLNGVPEEDGVAWFQAQLCPLCA